MTVDYGVLHHAVTPTWEEKSKAWLAQWFSDNGFARAYGSNPANWSGLINPFTGARSYTQTHAVGQRVNASTPDATQAERDAGYRVFYIVSNPLQVITWHAGEWTMNRRSMPIENLGDYRNYPLRDGDIKVIADFFRPLDKAVGGNFAVILHNEVYSTACPARIAEARNQIVNYINNPPQPPILTKPVPSAVKLASPIKFKVKIAKAEVWDLETNPNYKSTKTLSKGEEFIAFAYIDFNNTRYYQTEYSFGKNKTGVNQADLELVEVVTTKDLKNDESIQFPVENRDDASIQKGEIRIVQPGVNGIREITTRVTYVNGIETKREVIGSSIKLAPVPQITLVGTYEPPINPIDPNDGENALSWLERLIEWIKTILSNFTFKK